MNRYIRLVIRRRWLVLGLVALITCAAGVGMKRAVIASSVGGLFLNEHPDYPRYLSARRVAEALVLPELAVCPHYEYTCTHNGDDA